MDMLDKNVLTFIGCNADFADADIVLFGAPFDSTTSNRPGTRFGPRQMRLESDGLETYSPYQDRDLCDLSVCDSGDIELPFGDSSAALALIEERAANILSADKFPLMIGGEHLVTLGAFRAALQKYPDLQIVHFDAHTDLRDDYLGVKLSHASVIRRCWDLIGDGRIWQFGIRSGDRPEFYWAAEGHTNLHKFDFGGLEEAVAAIGDKPIYFTIDLDVLDPAYFPGTGTPEAGGVDFGALLGAIRTVCRGRVVAADINELSPMLDPSGISTAIAGKVLRELILAINLR